MPENIGQLRAYVAFEGGGARGIVHVGALQALEETTALVCGVAGTSAGAIVAALKATGYTAKEMVDVEAGTSILDLIQRTGGKRAKAVDLFGVAGWRRVLWFRRAVKFGAALRSRADPLISLSSIMSAVILAGLVRLDIEAKVALIFTSTLSAIGVLLVIIAFRQMFSGLVDLKEFISVLDTLLSAKMFPDNPTKRVTFGDLVDSSSPCLKIVSANISTKKLRLFTSTNPSDRSVAVSDAVAASIALPLIFRAHSIGLDRYVDGGIVSNLPAWPFDEERTLDKEAHTIAFSIEPFENDDNESQFFSLLNTMLFGASTLNMRAVSRLVTVPLRTALQTLDFDASRARFFDEVSSTAHECRKKLGQRLQYGPQLYTNACLAVQESVIDLLALLSEVDEIVTVNRVRVAVVFQEDGFFQSLRLRHYVGFENDNDEELLLPISSSIVGEAWRTGDEVLFKTPFPDHLNLSQITYRRHRKLLPADIKWVAAIPIFATKEARTNRLSPMAVVSIDGSSSLPTDEEALNFLLEEFTGFAVEIFSQFRPAE